MIQIGQDILASIKAKHPRPSWRNIIVLGPIMLAFLFLAIRTLSIGITGERAPGRVRAVHPAGIQNLRADIVDRNGEILAKNTYTFDLILNARLIKDADAAAAFIRELFPDMQARDIIERIASRRGQIVMRTNIERERALAIRRRRMDGVEVSQNQTRVYPKQNSTSHIVGFVHSSGQGAEGMERIVNDRLANNPEPLRLSIDSRIQSIMWTELSQGMKEYQARSAMGILMNARTGEIIAIVNVPDFDPENINDFPTANRRFRIMHDNFEMGSIFKIFTTAAALANGIDVNTTFNVADPFLVAGRPVGEARGFKPPAKNLNLAQIFQYSSNSGSAQIALSLPSGTQRAFYRELNFYDAINTDFGATARTRIPSSDNLTDRSRWSFGQGISVTPLHLLVAANAIINDGLFVMPTIYRRGFVPQARQVVPAHVSRQMRQILLTTGTTTGRMAANRIHSMLIGGKTSTAEKFIDGKYSETRHLTGYFATFPIQAPKWSILILLDEPMTTPRFASQNAVPLAGRILDAIIPLL